MFSTLIDNKWHIHIWEVSQLLQNVYFEVKRPTVCLCEFLTYVTIFKRTLKTQGNKSSQVHNAVSFTRLLYSLLEGVSGSCFLFLLTEKKQNCEQNWKRSWAIQSNDLSDFWKVKLWEQRQPSFPVSEGVQISW